MFRFITAILLPIGWIVCSMAGWIAGWLTGPLHLIRDEQPRITAFSGRQLF